MLIIQKERIQQFRKIFIRVFFWEIVYCKKKKKKNATPLLSSNSS
jgi:hypothetical protein